jgi:hypothetical protein
MTSVFISHSAADREVAEGVAKRLESGGCRTYFLDFDPDQGITGGQDWEKVLYQNLRACRTLLVLWSSQAANSRWVFAEVAVAKALGKKVLPVRLDSSALPDLISARQAIDLPTGEEAFARMLRLLEGSSSWEGADAFPWDRERSPYPGLKAMEREGAGVFFGRDELIQDAEERLRAFRRTGTAKILLALGPSGSGKSSFVRAGLLPKLEQEPEWIILSPFRPRASGAADPLEEISRAFAERLAALGDSQTAAEIRQALWEAAAIPADATVLRRFADALRERSGQRDASILVIVDQFEELLSGAGDSELSTRFLRLMSALSRTAGSRVTVLATLRSDFLSDLNRHPAARDLATQYFQVPPLAAEDWAPIIERPAARAGVLVERRLTDALVRETGSEDALPLLAFTLESLWRKRSGDQLTYDAYLRSGGLEKAIAMAAEDAFSAEPLSAQQREEARRAFTSLVAVSRGERFVRRRARWDDLPVAAQRMLTCFIQNRLIAVREGERGREIEFAHDAVLRSWARLGEWLRSDQDFLSWRSRLAERAYRRQPGDVLRGGALREAQRWAADPRSAILTAEERGLVDESLEEHRRALSRLCVALRAARPHDLPNSASLAVEALKQNASAESVRQVHLTLNLLPRLLGCFAHEADVTSVAASPDGRRFATGDASGRVRVWELGNERPILEVKHAGRITRVLFAERNQLLLTASEDRTAGAWNAHTGCEIARLEHAAAVVDVALDLTERRLLTVTGKPGFVSEGTVCIWDLARRRPIASAVDEQFVGAMLSPDGDWVVSGGHKREVLVWEAASGPGGRPAGPCHGHHSV